MRLSLKSFLASLFGGLVAGALDITYACLYSYLKRGTSPWRILQSVASGVFGLPISLAVRWGSQSTR